MSNSIANTVTTNILPVQALYDPTTLAFITFIGPAGTPFAGSGGGVTSVNVSGGTTGLTTTGGPVISSGTITLGGTLAVSNGGTGATSSAGALANLLPSISGQSGKYLYTDGSTISWNTSGTGLTINDDTTTNATRYLTFTSSSSGVITSENVASTKLTFNPSSGTLTSTTFVGALTGNASTATSATTATNLSGGSAGTLVYQGSTGSTSYLAVGTNGQYLTLSGGIPTWTNLTPVTTFSAGTTGLTPSTATTGAVTLAGTLNVANGGTGVTTSSGANSVVLRDSNANITVNCLFEGYSNVAASGTAIVLTASSAQNYVITGSGGQTIRLPNATTLPAGALFTFNNNQTSGAITVQNASSTTIATIQSGGYTVVVLLDNSTSAGSWDKHDQTPANVSWSTNTLSYPGSITSATWNGTAVGAIYGGTGQTSYATGDILYASATNTLSKLTAGTNGYVLTLSGGVPTWSATTSATTITDDTTTNSTRYINFTSATTGTLSTIYTSSTKLQYNPSTGALSVPQIGIGTSSPSQALTVVSSAGTPASFTSTGSNVFLALTNSGATTYIGNDSTSGSFVIQTPSSSYSTKLTVDNSGNLGLGVTPSAWNSSYKALQMPTGSFYSRSDTNQAGIFVNAYRNSAANYIYSTTDYATYYAQSGGVHQWFNAPSGTAGGTITFTQTMTLNNSGALGFNLSGSPSYGTAGQILTSGGSSASPTWTAVTGTGSVVLSSAPTLVNPTITNYTETLYTANTSTAITIALTNGTVQQLTLTANATITMPSVGAGKSFVIMLKQDATGSRTVTWSTVVWGGGTAPTITSTASKQDIYSFFSDGTNWYGATIGQNY